MSRQYRKVEITPEEYELQVKAWLEEAQDGLTKFKMEHLKKIEGDSGDYEIDVTAEFEIFGGAELKVLIECKRYSSPVKRDVIMVLESKLRDSSAHKGMVFSTSGFQSGALQYAGKRGIATIGFQEGKYNYETKSLNQEVIELPPWANISKYIGWYMVSTGPQSSRHSLVEKGRIDELSHFLRQQT